MVFTTDLESFSFISNSWSCFPILTHYTMCPNKPNSAQICICPRSILLVRSIDIFVDDIELSRLSSISFEAYVSIFCGSFYFNKHGSSWREPNVTLNWLVLSANRILITLTEGLLNLRSNWFLTGKGNILLSLAIPRAFF